MTSSLDNLPLPPAAPWTADPDSPYVRSTIWKVGPESRCVIEVGADLFTYGSEGGKLDTAPKTCIDALKYRFTDEELREFAFNGPPLPDPYITSTPPSTGGMLIFAIWFGAATIIFLRWFDRKFSTRKERPGRPNTGA